ncbi:MAG: purine-cytosine permease family protein, partial [Methylocella sp.]
VLGAIGIQMGLSLSEMFAIVILGNLAGAAIFGVFCTMGHRTGVPQLALSRLAFGRRGAYVPAVMMILMSMGWVATNTWIVLDLAVAALERMGITGGMGLKYALAVLLVALQIGIAAWGFNAIKYFERYSMPLILAIMAIMTMTAFFGVDVHWNNATLTGIAKWSAMSQMLTAIGIGWGLSWLIYASDCTRFTKTSLSGRQVFKATFLGMFVPTAWLACLGAAIASSGVGADPSQLIIATFGVMALPVLLVLLHGPIATNIVVIYSAALSALALDVRQPRWMISLACGLGGAVILYLYLQSGDFANVFNSFMAVMVAWVGVWGGVTFADFYIVRGGRVNISELYTENPAHRYGVN